MNIRGGLPASWRNWFRAVLAVLALASASSALGADPLTLTSISPTSGSSAGGTPFTLTGSGFVAGMTVVFDSGAATNVVVIDSSHLTAVAPPHAVGPATIFVSLPDNTSTSMGNAFVFASTPTVSNLTPASGPASGGTPVTITGTNFVGVTGVSFGGTPGTNVTTVSPTSITVTSPPGSGTVGVTVTAAGGTSAANANFVYTAVVPTLAINTTALAAGMVGQPYNQPLSVSGGTAPYSYVITGLPSGLGIANGAIAGTPTQAGGPYNINITVTDSSSGPGAPFSTTKTLPLTINPATSNQVPSAPAVQAQTSSTAPVVIHATANAAGGPFTRVAISTPPSSGTAVVNGEDIVYTPAAATSGNVSFAYTLTNAFGTSAPIAVTVTVAAVPVPASNLQATVDANGTTDIDITGAAAGGPFTAATIVSVSPANAGTVTLIATPASAVAAGATLRAATAASTGNSYRLRFAPAAAFAGTAIIAYTLSNANATSAPATVRVTVAPRKDPSTDPDVTGLIGAQVEAARRFATTQIGNYNSRLEALHGTARDAHRRATGST